jgi:hypothetical protein
MTKTAKSPLAVLRIAYEVAKQAVPKYSHNRSPHTYTQPQLLACLVLKEFLRLDYRGLVGVLADCPTWRGEIGLRQTPHFTTFQKAASRLLSLPSMELLLDRLIVKATEEKVIGDEVKKAALDGTGLESRHTSAYFINRMNAFKRVEQDVTYRKYPSLGMVSDCKSHLVLSAVTGHGPKPDITHFHSAVTAAARRVKIDTLLADKGYDAEWAHELCRNQLKIRSIIPAKNSGRKPRLGKRKKKPVGRYRRLMTFHFPKKLYAQRWQAETLNSMIKRRLGAALRARTSWTQRKELGLRVITHNAMII